jgi:CHAD domain-containing protein
VPEQTLRPRRSTWDVDRDFVLPDLDAVIRGGQLEQDTADTVTAFYDTDDAALWVHGIEFSRRDGDQIPGWQVRVGDTEVQWALTDGPPQEAVGLLTGATGGQRLHHVGTVHTVRHRHRVTDPDSRQVLAQVAEDDTTASSGDRLLAWRQINVEVDDTAAVRPRRLGRLLRTAGARPARYPGPLARLRGDDARPPADPLTSYLDAQIAAIVAGDIGLRRGLDPIHDTRVALRRLRSTLRVFAPVFTPDALALQDDLSWFAGLLGEVRDCQVQRSRFDAALDELPDELVLGPVRARVSTHLQAIELPARAQVSREMDAPRYLALLAELTRWRRAAPLRSTVTGKALARRAGKAERTAARRLADAVTGSGHDELLHRARKAAKRARYGAEVTADKRTIKRFKQIQSVLGDHQDTVVAREQLRRMAITAGTTDGENGFAFGLLYAREQQIADNRVRAAGRLR